MTWHRSSSITTALRAGVRPDVICLITCDGCASVTYYDPGSDCSCEHCGADLNDLVVAGGGAVITLQDVWDAEEAALEDQATCRPHPSRRPLWGMGMRRGADASAAGPDLVPNHEVGALPRDPGRISPITT
jgi:hypothetical protein